MEEYDTTITKEEFFSILDYAREKQKIVFEIFQEFYEICSTHDIQFSLCEGSLLGAVRHGGFVPWDDDIDIYMTLKNISKLKSVPSQSLTITNSNYPNLYFCKNSSNQKIDIMTDKFKNSIYMDKQYQACVFEKKSVLIPKDTIDILNHNYPDWQSVCYITNHKIAREKFNTTVAYKKDMSNKYYKLSYKLANQWIKDYISSIA